MANWHITLAGVELGPIGDDHLRRLADLGRLKPDDHVRKVGMRYAVEAARIKGLFDFRNQHADQQNAGSLATFSAWYRHHPGRWPVWAQLIAWFLYGFLWIPGWWALDLICSCDEEVHRFGKRVLETVGCIAIVVVIAVTVREKQHYGAEPPVKIGVPSGITVASNESP